MLTRLVLPLAIAGCSSAAPLPLAKSAAQPPKLAARVSAATPARRPDASPAPANVDAGASQIAGNVQAFYGGLHSFRATFKQRYGFYDKIKDSSGVISFERPDKMSWRYESGVRIVSDGSQVVVYEPEEHRMYEPPLDKVQYPTALSFMIGPRTLDETFRLSALESKRFGWHLLAGTPRLQTSAFERAFFYVDAQSYQVRRVILVDAQGNRNRFDLTLTSTNQPMPADEFRFVPPPGTQVIRP